MAFIGSLNIFERNPTELFMSHEHSIHDQLKALIRLQYIDSRIDQVTKLRGDLPDEIRDLEDERAGLQTRLEKYEQEQKEQEVARRQSELSIKESEALIARYEEQQLQVRNNREYDALTKEIEAQRQRIIESKQAILSIEQGIAPRESMMASARERLGVLAEVLSSKQDELNNVLADTKQEQDALETVRAEAADHVEKRYLRAYTRLRNRVRDGRAVVKLDRGAAAGYAVPPQRQVEIRQRNRIIVCEHTGRIIVDGDLYEETTAPMDM